MIKLLLAVAAIGLLAGQASAQSYGDNRGGYRQLPPGVDGRPGWRDRGPSSWCQANAARLRQFERRTQLDGRVSRDEARIATSLRADLASSCGGGRWHPQRGWHYR